MRYCCRLLSIGNLKGLPRVFPRPGFAPTQSVRHILNKVPPTTISRLPNGFRVACEEHPESEVATVGVWIDAGSRYETPEINGTAHFLEHMNFKGTRSMTKAQLERKFEEIGGHLNAYTARDRTSYYVKVFKKYVPDAVSILADILRNSKLPEKDLERERSTILEEMREVELLVDEVVMDHLHIAAYRDCSLGLTILGPEQNISTHINRDMIVRFVDQHYTGPRMVLVGAGGVTHKSLETLASQYFGDLSPKCDRGENHAAIYTGGQYTLWSKELPALHLALAFQTCGIASEDVFALQVVQHLLGSYNRVNRDLMSKQRFRSPQCLAMRFPTEDGGSVLEPDPRIETFNPFFTPYIDSGLMGVYLIGYPQENNVQHHLRSVMEFFSELCSTRLSDSDLELAKSNLKAALVLNVDGTTNIAEDIGRQLLHADKRLSLEEYFTHVDAVSSERIRDVMNRYYRPGSLCLSTVGPVCNASEVLVSTGAIPGSDEEGKKADTEGLKESVAESTNETKTESEISGGVSKEDDVDVACPIPTLDYLSHFSNTHLTKNEEGSTMEASQ